MYTLGKKIRNQYHEFLNTLYTPDILTAIASYYNRSKTSLQLFLYGLFPASKKYGFSAETDWQPIPFSYISKEHDEIFNPILNCPKYKEVSKQYLQSLEFKKQFESDSAVLNYIREKSGNIINSYFDLFFIHSALKSESEWGYKLPDWTKSIYPKKLEELVYKGFKETTATTEHLKIAGGSLIKKIIEDTQAKIFNKKHIENKQLIIYSGHDLTIVGMLAAMKMLSTKTIPKYGSHLIIELHQVNESYGLKVSI